MGRIKRVMGDKGGALKMYEEALDYYQRFAVKDSIGKQLIVKKHDRAKEGNGLSTCNGRKRS